MSTAIFRPSADRTVLVVAAGDVAAVETTLRPQLGARLCVVPSRSTRAEIDAAIHLLADRFSVWAVYEFGEGVDDEGQPFVSVALTRMLPEVAESLGTPPGLVRLQPWLAPSR